MSYATKSFQARGFNTAVDFPPAYFFRDLVDAFPDAKIVLSTRDAGGWHESVQESTMRTQNILRSFPANIVIGMKPGMTERLELAYKLSTIPPKGFSQGMFPAINAGKTESEKFFAQWLREVQSYVPKDRLLLFSVKDGWEPLCKFVNAPVPDLPFPRANDRETMAKSINKVRNIGWAIVLGTPMILATMGYGVVYALGMI